MDTNIAGGHPNSRPTSQGFFTHYKNWLSFATMASLVLVCVLVFFQVQITRENIQWQLDQPGADPSFLNLLTLLVFTVLLLLVNGLGSLLMNAMTTKTEEETNRRKTGNRLHLGTEAYRLLAKISPQIVWASRPNGSFTHCNQYWLDFTGLTMEQTLGKGWMDALDPDCRDLAENVWKEALEKGTDFQAELLFHKAADNSFRWHQFQGSPLKDDKGRIIMWIGVAVDIHEQRQRQELEEYRKRLEEANLQLESLATTDCLTRLNNRQAFQEKLTEEVKRTHRYASPLSLLLLDVDHFKEFNDTYGHPAGDDALRDMGRVLEKSTRNTDFVARYGGEEFAILMPGTDQKGAMASAEKIRKAVEDCPWRRKKITVSIGVATIESTNADGAALVEEADEALYLSKREGRNCVHIAADKTLADYFQGPA